MANAIEPRWATSATFFDYDRDGRLDLFISNYLRYDPAHECKSGDGQPDYCPPTAFPGLAGKLFHNLGGDELRFDDVTEVAGLASTAAPALGVIAADLTGDGWTDLLVANDAQANHLWVNQQNGTFADEADKRGVAVSLAGKPKGNMGIAYADADGDGLLDLFITHLGREMHTLWRQNPRGMFLDVTQDSKIAGSGMRATGFGAIMEDFDHDGDVDVAIANGRVVIGEPANAANLGPHFARYAETNHLFLNENGMFRNASAANPAFCGTPGVYRGLASGDLDGDGAIDLVVTQIGGRARILRNVAGGEGNWLQVRAVDAANRDALSAEVTIRAGDRRFVRRSQSDGSYQSANSPIAHFGLGTAKSVESIEVLWPNGRRESFQVREINKLVTCQQGKGMPVVNE